MTKKLYSQNDLRALGISHSRQHFYRLIKAGKMPAPIKFGGRTSKLFFHADEIDAWIKARMDARPAQAV